MERWHLFFNRRKNRLGRGFIRRGLSGGLKSITFIVLLALPSLSSAVPVTGAVARRVAENFLVHLNAAHGISTIGSVASSGKSVGFLVTLSPEGYILVAGDDTKAPIKGYSLKSAFSSLPAAYIANILKDLEPSQVRAKSAALPRTANSPYWDYLRQDIPAALRRDYVADTYLLTTTWGQGYPYNKFNPLSGGEPTVTGCTQTAVAQIMRYHKYPAAGSGVFRHSWGGQELVAVMNRPFNWQNMPNDATATSLAHEQDEVAALMLDLGIMNTADFDLSATSASFNRSGFSRAFGYAEILGKHIDEAGFFETMRDEIDNLRPVLLVMPGHMTVADGYSSDQTGKKIHVNLGWEGAYDNYYYLDDDVLAGGYSFPPDHSIYYNIKPCAAQQCAEPYPPLGTNTEPVIGRDLPDIAFNGAAKVRVDSYDPDGDDVTLSAFSSCEDLQVSVNKNIVSLSAEAVESFCQVDVFAQSHDGYASQSFRVLTTSPDVHIGQEFAIAGQFADQGEIDQYTVFLGGETAVSGSRGYQNQAFFIWVKTAAGDTVVSPTASAVSAHFTPGLYTVYASLENQSGSYYSYSADHSNYRLTVDLGMSLAEVAASLNLSMPLCQLELSVDGAGAGAITHGPAQTPCGNSCMLEYVCNSAVLVFAAADSSSLFTGWSGDCSGRETPRIVAVENGKTCTADFAVDAEQDGMADDWETTHGLNTSLNDADEDADGDGIANIDEYLHGTSPSVRQGDLDGDGVVTLADGLLAVRLLAGEDIPRDLYAADVDGDGKLGLAEALFCLKHLAGL